jgi:hypothetical protein
MITIPARLPHRACLADGGNMVPVFSLAFFTKEFSMSLRPSMLANNLILFVSQHRSSAVALGRMRSEVFGFGFSRMTALKLMVQVLHAVTLQVICGLVKCSSSQRTSALSLLLSLISWCVEVLVLVDLTLIWSSSLLRRVRDL